ncbi:dynamin-like protein ARC5 isoform X2 [Quercus lobata]|uniref:dynamin-like protein ARC5 isoform X2 n=1 Tax=Quercus lobata TaxID=97700 RepID=UPI001244A7DE|nr:dynamin-like protein ARC5 isoform X2 [Quercus lobata]
MSWFGILAPEIRSTPSSSSSRGRINQFPFAVLKLPTRTFCTAARSCSHTALEGRAIPNSFSNDSLYLLSNIIAKYLKGHSFLRQQNTHVKQLWRFEARCSKESSRPRKLCCIRCMEDLISTTRYITWSLHNKFNCFPLMPVVDKLPALLREDLESAFEDDLDNIFDITN